MQWPRMVHSWQGCSVASPRVSTVLIGQALRPQEWSREHGQNVSSAAWQALSQANLDLEAAVEEAGRALAHTQEHTQQARGLPGTWECDRMRPWLTAAAVPCAASVPRGGHRGRAGPDQQGRGPGGGQGHGAARSQQQHAAGSCAQPRLALVAPSPGGDKTFTSVQPAWLIRRSLLASTFSQFATDQTTKLQTR